MERPGEFYLGRLVNPEDGERTDENLYYDPDDLTTHGVVVGMTGSGKTGLCIDILEEAALNRIPVIMIDPKGDITNALLHFPSLSPDAFRPWVNADEARREGRSPEEAAEAVANLWKNGLAEWGIGPERIARLNQQVDYAVYTPGSDAGLKVSILASLEAPPLAWDTHAEVLRERISGTVTALLGLVGLRDIDPVRSREHILLATIFEHAWSQGKDLTLPELIMQVQNPPFQKLGVFEVATFFPDKERFGLAMDLNSILASPAFQSWLAGEPLQIGSLLYQPDGTPRHSVFYIAHLSDAERMFFVTLLFSAVESWMRTQSGSTTLRALIYFDEIFGYLPPNGKPPSKEPILRMLKQARAFGVGLLLATQNPVDVDYKALSNAGTWFVGKLGTDQDKQRLLDGLSSAMGGGLDRREYDDLISRLGKRVFLLRNVHEKEPAIFQTRWAMNYLAGPVTRRRIPELNALVGAEERAAAPAPGGGPPTPATAGAARPREVPSSFTLPGSETRPAIRGKVDELFLPAALKVSEAARAAGRSLPPDAAEQGMLYRPALVAHLSIRYNKRKYDLDHTSERWLVAEEPPDRSSLDWDAYQVGAMEARSFDRRPEPEARFENLKAPLNQSRALTALQRDLQDWAYRESEVTVRANEELGVYAGPGTSQQEFESAIEAAIESERDADVKKVEESFERKIKAIETKLRREQRELQQDEQELSARKQEEMGTHFENILGIFTGRRRRISTSMSKRRMSQRAASDVQESKEQIQEFEEDIQELKKEFDLAVDEIDDKWDEVAADLTEIAVTPFKKDVVVERFGILWLPHHLVEADGHLLELPAYTLPE